MIRNYITVAFRHFSRSILFSVINVFGLVIGITASSFLMLYVWDELKQDQFHEYTSSIYRITTRQNQGEISVVTPGPLGPELIKDHTDIVKMARVGKWTGTFKYKDQIFEESLINFADHDFLTMFSFPMLVGAVNNALLMPDELLLTERAASKYFGSSWRRNPEVIGSDFILNGNEHFRVVGVLQNPPANSSIQFDFLLSFEYVVRYDSWGYQWGSHNFHTYVQVAPDTDPGKLADAIQFDLKKQLPEAGFELGLQPLADMYMDPASGYDWNKHGEKQYVTIFFVVGLVILIVACFNYVNLSTARARQRSREVGIRKVIGAYRRQLFYQFMGESLLIVLFSALISRGLLDLLLAPFNLLIGKQLDLSHFQIELIIELGCIVVITSLLSGVYPAILLSSFKPLNVLSRKISTGSGRYFRSILVTTQFTMSMVLIIGTLVVNSQLNFIQSKDVGFNRKELAFIKLGGSVTSNGDALKNALVSSGFIEKASLTTTTLVNTNNGSYIDWPGKKQGEEITISQMNVDVDFLPLMEIELARGRNFTDADSGAYVLNMEAVKAMGFTADNVLGVTVKFWGTEGKIIGVVDDFNFRPLHYAVTPMIIRHAPKENFFNLLVRIEKHNMSRFNSEIERIYKKYANDYPFQYGFVDEMIQEQYGREQSLGSMVLYFSGLSIFVSMLGLFGLVAYLIEVRAKEFSIRRILGSTYFNMLELLSNQFMMLLVIAFAIAVPLSWWITSYWLTNFSYRVDIDPMLYFKTLLLVTISSVGIISLQALIACNRNPADILKVQD